MRLDKLLWFLRLAKTRPLAQALISEGHLRLNGRRIERAAQAIAIGDILVIPLPSRVTVIEIMALPTRRGPATEALACYRVLDGQAVNPIAAGEQQAARGNPPP
jgi:ribosome-associated heat shock protein Hsp15